jgi:hypothetical protein
MPISSVLELRTLPPLNPENDVTVYIVVEDYGDLGRAFRETDIAEADFGSGRTGEATPGCRLLSAWRRCSRHRSSVRATCRDVASNSKRHGDEIGSSAVEIGQGRAHTTVIGADPPVNLFFLLQQWNTLSLSQRHSLAFMAHKTAPHVKANRSATTTQSRLVIAPPDNLCDSPRDPGGTPRRKQR